MSGQWRPGTHPRRNYLVQPALFSYQPLVNVTDGGPWRSGSFRRKAPDARTYISEKNQAYLNHLGAIPFVGTKAVHRLMAGRA